MHNFDVPVGDLLNGLRVIYSGEHVCPPGHRYGPHTRDYYLMHYILEGQGTFETHGKSYALAGGDVFFIRPDEMTVYQADMQNPWHYVWIGLRGMDAGNIFDLISAKAPVLHIQNREEMTLLMQCFARENVCRTATERFARIGNLYMILSKLMESTPEAIRYKPGSQSYVEEAAMFIQSNLHRRITVSEIAGQICIDRSYLCALFKQYMGISPQQYIIAAKMKSAAGMLRLTSDSVMQIAAAVGYDDPLLFSRIFRSRFGVSPRTYRCAGNKADDAIL